MKFVIYKIDSQNWNLLENWIKKPIEWMMDVHKHAMIVLIFEDSIKIQSRFNQDLIKI